MRVRARKSANTRLRAGDRTDTTTRTNKGSAGAITWARARTIQTRATAKARERVGATARARTIGASTRERVGVSVRAGEMARGNGKGEDNGKDKGEDTVRVCEGNFILSTRWGDQV